MISPQVKAQHSDLLDARFREIFANRFQLSKTVYDKVFQIENSDRSYEMYSSESGLDYPKQVPEYGEIPEDGMIQGFDTTFTNAKFMRATRVSAELVEDDLFKKIDKQAQQLAKSMGHFSDYRSADMFKRGFDATNSEGEAMVAADGQRHFSTLHPKNPLELGTTYSNASATGISLTEDNLEIGVLALNDQLNERGQLVQLEASRLIVPQNLRKSALIITGSEKRSDTADNDMNVYKGSYSGGELEVVVWNQLGSASRNGSSTAWFLQDKDEHQMIFQWRKRPEVKPIVYDEDRDAWKWTGRQRFTFGMVDWRGVWGSKGDNQVYNS